VFEMMFVLIGLAVWLGACALVCGFMMVTTGGETSRPDMPARRPTLVYSASARAEHEQLVSAGPPDRDVA
jgi:hypothetical protein